MTSTLVERVQYKLFPILLRVSMIFRLPRLTAWVLASSVTELNPKGGHTVLCLRRSIFTDDLKAMAKFSGKIKYLILNRGDLKQVLFYFLTPKEREELTEDNYHLPGTAAVGKSKYRNYLRAAWPYLMKRLRFQAVFVGNIGYVEQQELAALCEELRFPFIVLHKEGMAVQDQYAEYAKIYATRKFIGSKILFYNENIKRALFDIGLPGLTEEKSVVVGIPRLDAYFEMAREAVKEKTLAFFSFYPHDKIRYLVQDEHMREKILERSVYFHRLIMEFAKNHPEVRVVIKTKFARHYLKYVQDIQAGIFADTLPNLFVTNTANTTDLICDADVVIGFNSTTLVEAIAAARIVVSPYFGDIITGKSWDYFARYPELVNYAKSQVDLEGFVFYPERNAGIDPSRRQKFLEELIYTPDGRASTRAEDAIIHTIQTYAKN